MHACCATVEFEWLSDPRPPAKRLQASNLIHATQKKEAVLRKNLVSYPYLEVSVCFFFAQLKAPSRRVNHIKQLGKSWARRWPHRLGAFLPITSYKVTVTINKTLPFRRNQARERCEIPPWLFCHVCHVRVLGTQVSCQFQSIVLAIVQ